MVNRRTWNQLHSCLLILHLFIAEHAVSLVELSLQQLQRRLVHSDAVLRLTRPRSGYAVLVELLLHQRLQHEQHALQLRVGLQLLLRLTPHGRAHLVELEHEQQRPHAGLALLVGAQHLAEVLHQLADVLEGQHQQRGLQLQSRHVATLTAHRHRYLMVEATYS